MWYAVRHDTSDVRASRDGRRARAAGGRLALVRRVSPPSVPDSARQRTGGTDQPDRSRALLHRPDRPRGAPRLQPAWAGRPHARLAPRQDHPPRFRAHRGGAAARPLAPEPADVRQTHEPLDPGAGGRGELRRGAHPDPGQWRDDPRHPGAAGGALEAGQAVDHESGSGVRAEKSARDRLIRLAATHPDWALGFEDEVWWSRVAQPALHSWAEPDRPLRLVEQAIAKDDPDPKALACYGLLLRSATEDGGWHEETWLRFVDGRPVSAVTTAYLDWCC